MIQNIYKSNLQCGCMCAQHHLKAMIGKWEIDYDEHLSILKDGMASSVLCFFEFRTNRNYLPSRRINRIFV